MMDPPPNQDKLSMTTAAEFNAMLAELQAALDACSAADERQDDAAYDAAGGRLRAALDALRDARPTDPATMARQIRWIVDEHVMDATFEPALLAIAEQLEA
jgi:hypothetical protein